MLTILGSIINMIEGEKDLYDHLTNTTIFTLNMNRKLIWTLESTKKTATNTILIC